SLTLLKNDLEVHGAFFSNLTKHLRQIDFQKKLIELLWVTSSNGTSVEFKKCMDQILGNFNFAEAFLVVYNESLQKFQLEYQFKGQKKIKDGADYIFEKDLAGLTFLENESGGRECRKDVIFVSNGDLKSRFSWITGDLLVLPGVLGNKLIG